MDYRVANFPNTFSPVTLAELENVFIWVDKSDWSDAKKMTFFTWLYNSVITGGTIDYKPMTPSSFYNSIATETRRGITEGLASDTDIDNKSTNKVLIAAKIAKLIERFNKDMFESALVPKSYFADSLAIPHSMVLNVTYSGSLGTIHKTITPTLPAGYRFKITRVTWAAGSTSNFQTGSSELIWTGSDTYIVLEAVGGIRLYVLAAGNTITLVRTTGTDQCDIAITLQCVIKYY